MHSSTGEFQTQMDQRSDDSNLQHVKGKKVETVIKWYHRCSHETLYR